LWYKIFTIKGVTMTLEDRIANLKDQHAAVHEECEENPTTELKKQKLALKDEIQDLEWAEMYQGGVENFGTYQ